MTITNKYFGALLAALLCCGTMQQTAGMQPNKKLALWSVAGAGALWLGYQCYVRYQHWANNRMHATAELFDALSKNDNAQLREAIEHGADLNAFAPPCEDVVNNRTPLHVAYGKANTNALKLLVESGANINKACTDTWALLHRACAAGQFEVVKYLVEHKADLEIEDNGSRTPLLMACSWKHDKIAKYLIEHGAHIPEHFCNLTMLHHACENGLPEVTKLLIARGANINASVDYGHWEDFTPLRFACEEFVDPNARRKESHLETIKILIAHGTKIHPNIAEGAGTQALEQVPQECWDLWHINTMLPGACARYLDKKTSQELRKIKSAAITYECPKARKMLTAHIMQSVSMKTLRNKRSTDLCFDFEN